MTILYNQSVQREKRRTLRNQIPQAEKLLWEQIRNKQIKGIKFRRQFGVGKYVVDFYSPQLKLGIEIDGNSHFNKSSKYNDIRRQRYLNSLGIKLIRFTNFVIYHNSEIVIQKLSTIYHRGLHYFK